MISLQFSWLVGYNFKSTNNNVFFRMPLNINILICFERLRRRKKKKKTGTRLIFVQHMSGFSALFQSRLFFIILYTFPAFFYQPSIIRGQTVIHCMFSIYTFPRERKRKGENSSASPPDYCNWKSLFFNYCTRRFEEGNCGSFFMESTHAALFLSRFKVIFLWLFGQAGVNSNVKLDNFRHFLVFRILLMAVFEN